ncbi:MAG: hypothetical protein KME60_14430 [Cyanomargarita calcarea GSE-NOS-MK-12-04C]|jgi:hypothetical protein|uniref:Uncharacterized protein n=1 Tax=Cyanomargarita calcarea GSE-NOS-MK-12-04C TaxID=2839659 RepID=A0A951UT52_9CYAN|nr:hypothetical protein [Cyanomargarita calcarea GSE-NOS-MK-12-04C]
MNEGRRKKEEGRRKKEEGRRMKDEGRRKRFLHMDTGPQLKTGSLNKSGY